jgi:hypothetical protein
MKKFYVIITLFIIISNSCDTSEIEQVAENDYDYDYFDDSIANNKNYDAFQFPRRLIKESYQDSTIIDSLYNSSLSYFLTAFKEDSLSVNGDSIIRFMWLRTFDKPVLIKIEKEKNRYIITNKITDGSGGYESGTIEYIGQHYLPDSIWKSLFSYNLTKVLKQQSFEDYKGGNDGDTYVLEISIDGKYFLIERWSPYVFLEERDTINLADFNDYCNNIIKLAKYPLENELIIHPIHRRKLRIK